MSIRNPKSPYVLAQKVRTAVIRATFGSLVAESQILAFHSVWNGLLKQVGCKPCWFDPNKTKSGCRLPMCPRCAVRARVKLCKGVLSWNWRTPDAQMSLFEHQILSTSPAEFLHLFDPTVLRKTQPRGRGSTVMKTVGTIATTAWGARARLPEHMIDEDDPKTQARWIHRRLVVLWHDPASDVTKLRCSAPVVDPSITMQSIHSTMEDLLQDGTVWGNWRSDDHAGKLLVGALLGRFDNVATYLTKGGAPAMEFLAHLRSANRQRHYSRVNAPPGGWKGQDI